ncbi:unnamed protein product, partial [marine sediment metagenome]
NFLYGIKQSRKVIFGNDILGEIDFSFNKNYLLKIAPIDLKIFKFQLLRSPLSYDLDNDFDLFLNECLVLGKMISYLGVEIVLTDDEIKNGDHLNYIFNKRNMLRLYREKYNQEVSKNVEYILYVRENYRILKKLKSNAIKLFRASYNLEIEVERKLKEVIKRSENIK